MGAWNFARWNLLEMIEWTFASLLYRPANFSQALRKDLLRRHAIKQQEIIHKALTIPKMKLRSEELVGKEQSSEDESIE